MSRFMEKKILAVLLDSYERSRLFREGDSALAAEGLIEYDWVRYEEGNLIDRIFLRTEEAAVRQSYLRIGRVRKQAQLDVLESQVQAALFRIEAAFQKIEGKGDEKITAWLRAALEDGCCSFSSFLRGMKTNFWSGWSAPDCMGTASTLSASFGARFCPFCAGSRRMAMRRN